MPCHREGRRGLCRSACRRLARPRRPGRSPVPEATARVARVIASGGSKYAALIRRFGASDYAADDMLAKRSRCRSWVAPCPGNGRSGTPAAHPALNERSGRVRGTAGRVAKRLLVQDPGAVGQAVRNPACRFWISSCSCCTGPSLPAVGASTNTTPARLAGRLSCAGSPQTPIVRVRRRASAGERASPPSPKITECTASAAGSPGAQNLPPWMRRLRWDWPGSP
jgi:hypothetical protein